MRAQAFNRRFESAVEQRPSQYVTLLTLTFILLMLAVGQEAAASEVAFVWDAVADSRVDHYEVHYGRTSGHYDNHLATTATSVAVAGLESGATYYFAARACDQAGTECSEFTHELTATIPEAPPVAALTASVMSGDAPLTVNFVDQSTGNITTRTWDFGDGGTSGAATAIYTYSVPGIYTVSLTVTGPGGTNTQTKSALIDVKTPVPAAGYSADILAGDAPLTVAFQDSSTGSITAWNWSFGDGSTSTEPKPIHTYTMPGIYPVALTVSGPGGSNTLTRDGYIQVAEVIAPPPPAANLPLEIGEIEISDEWQRIEFQKSFSDPVVVVKALSYNDTDPAVVRIKGIDPEGFWARVQEWDYLDGWHAFETAGYIVMERGRHQLPDGVWVEAGSVNTSKTNAFQYQAFSTAFGEAPVVFAAVTTVNEEDAVNARLKGVTVTGFSIGMREQESNTQKHLSERIDYIAWEPSAGEVGGMQYEVGRTDSQVTHQTYGLIFGSVFELPPVFVGDMQTTNGGDAASLRWDSKTSVLVDIWVDEEQSRDAETDHTTEVVGYLLVATDAEVDPGLSVIYEDGADGDTLGWDVYANSPAGATIKNVEDPDTGDRVIAVSGAGWSNGYRLRGEDGRPWADDAHHVLRWDMKYAEYFHVYVDVQTSAGQRYLEYTPTTEPDRLGAARYIHHSLDVGLTDGSWQRVERNLAADLAHIVTHISPRRQCAGPPTRARNRQPAEARSKSSEVRGNRHACG